MQTSSIAGSAARGEIVRHDSAVLTGTESREAQHAQRRTISRIGSGFRFAFTVCRLLPLIVPLVFSKGWPWSIAAHEENYSIRDDAA